MKRIQKIALIESLLNGSATAKQLDDLRQSKEPIHLTMILDSDQPTFVDPDEPTLHITHFSDGSIESYFQYPNGEITKTRKA